MTGHDRKEYMRRFALADKILKREGFRTINPTRVLACRFTWIYKIVGYRLVLLYDLWLLITRADGIVFLPGWECSRGANIEKVVSDYFPMMGVSRRVTDIINTELSD